jgi:2-iminobutanoate/2-iminopropanoate deaminase
MSRRKSVFVEGLDHGDNPIPLGSRIESVFASGGISGKDVQAGTLPESAEDQCRNMFANVERVMAAAGGTPDDIISMKIYVTNRDVRPVINEHWVAMFPDDATRPARHVLVAELLPRVHLNCEVLAVIS